MRETARRAFIAAIVIGGVIVIALALWKVRILIALLFMAFIIAAAMRPGIEWLRRHGVPRGAGIGLHYLGLAALVAVMSWLVVPRALDEVRQALPDGDLDDAADESTGFRRQILLAVQERLEDFRAGTELIDPAVEVTVLTFEIFIGIFFVLASAAYWIFERDRAVNLVASMMPRPRRKLMRDTWTLIDLKLGAYVRGQGILILLVGTILSITFAVMGLPYAILIGAFAGLVEIIPVIGPLAAGGLAVGVGLTESWQLGLAAGLAVLVVRLTEDYLIIPRVLGEAVGLSPLLVLFAVTSVGILFGGFAVLLAIPLAAVITTLIDVVVLSKDPSEEDVPTVIFAAKDAE